MEGGGSSDLEFEKAVDDADVTRVMPFQNAEFFANAVETMNVAELGRLEHLCAKFGEFDAVARFSAGDKGVAVMPISV